METIAVTVPEGAEPGQTLQVQSPTTGQPIQVQIPKGVEPGQQFQAQVPAPEPIVPAVQQPTAQNTTTTVNVQLPAEAEKKAAHGDLGNALRVKMPDAADLCMLLACCCDKCSIYTKFPECCGCVDVSECLCCKTAATCRLQTEHLACCYEGGERFCFDKTMDCTEDGFCAVNESCICCFCCECSSTSKCAIPTTCIKGAQPHPSQMRSDPNRS